MGQKIHPVGFRLGITKEHKSCWYADAKHYPELLQEDRRIRQYVEKNLANAGIADIRIERKADQVDISIHTARPGVVVGRGGTGIEQLRVGLQKALGSHRQIRINVIEVARIDADANLIAEYIAQQLERRVSFRRVVRQAIQRAQRAEVKGIKIQVSGRLNGAEIARTEWVREGRVPLHTLRADIDYSYKTASTIYGILGVKVWIFKGEIIPGQEEIPAAVPAQAPRRQQRRRQQFEDHSFPERDLSKRDRDRDKIKYKELNFDMSKIDPYLIYAFDLLERGFSPGNQVTTIIKNGKNIKLIDIFLEVFDGENWQPNQKIQDYKETFRIGSFIGCLGSFQTFSILQEDESIKSIKAGSKGKSESFCVNNLPNENNNKSSAIQAQQIEEKGDKAIIVFIDDGINIFHQTFDDINNQTRILSVFDIKNEQKYNQNQIQVYINNFRNDNDLQSIPDVFRQIQLGSGNHGTSVASVAAGKPFMGFFVDNKNHSQVLFDGGVAQEAKIVMIIIDQSIPLERNLGESIKHIQEIAKTNEFPIVVNISQGTNLGGHDGNSFSEKLCDEIGKKDNIFIVKSAGNEQQTKLHSRFRVPTNYQLIWNINQSQTREHRVQVWLASSLLNFQFRLCPPGLTSDQFRWITSENLSAEILFPSRNVEYKNQYNINYLRDNDNTYLDIIINKLSEQSSIRHGKWKLEIRNQSKQNNYIHSWIEIGSSNIFDLSRETETMVIENISFKDHSREVTLTIPGTGNNIITVAAVTKKHFDVNDQNDFSVTSFSSFGPTCDERRDKPYISAPGDNIWAASSQNLSYIIVTLGTSVAAPQIAGAIALVVSARAKNPNLPTITLDQIQEAMRETAMTQISDWDEGMGFGVIDINRFYDHFLQSR